MKLLEWLLGHPFGDTIAGIARTAYLAGLRDGFVLTAVTVSLLLVLLSRGGQKS